MKVDSRQKPSGTESGSLRCLGFCGQSYKCPTPFNLFGASHSCTVCLFKNCTKPHLVAGSEIRNREQPSS